MRKTTSVKLAITLLAMLGAACTPKVKDTNHNFQSPKGDNAGQVIFFTNDASFSNREVVSIVVNNKYLAAMNYKSQHTQGLCAGNYVIEAQAIAPQLNKHKEIQHQKVRHMLNVEAGKVKYVLLERKTKSPFLSLKEVDKAVWEKGGKLGEANNRNIKFVHRLEEAAMNCKLTAK
ncbi:hypothetical protein JFL47_00515 [Haemophilus haemoglobinophilus]|nr:hypothetical protein [Canicola haemoglobinophilus]